MSLVHKQTNKQIKTPRYTVWKTQHLDSHSSLLHKDLWNKMFNSEISMFIEDSRLPQDFDWTKRCVTDKKV